MENPRVTIYYDGTCKMCSSFARGVKKRAPEQALVDATGKLPAEAPADRKALMRDIHLVEEDGTVRTGPDAVMTSLARSSRLWLPLAWLVRLWPLSLLAKLIYRLVAKFRYWLSRFYD